MNKYTLTEIVSAKKKAFNLKLYGVAATYRYLELTETGAWFDSAPLQPFVILPDGMYINFKLLLNTKNA